jgi:hypothetical protein
MPNPFDEDYDPMQDPTYLMRAQLDELREIKRAVGFLAGIGGAAFVFTAGMIFFGPWG